MDANLQQYAGFVREVTSVESNHLEPFIERCRELEKTGMCNVPLLMTSAIGLSSETGEFNEIVKKLVFQGKVIHQDLVFHMKRELGDILWYWANACRSLGLNPDDVMLENVNKLKSRYPEGKFDSFFSENRKPGDL